MIIQILSWIALLSAIFFSFLLWFSKDNNVNREIALIIAAFLIAAIIGFK